MPGIKLYGGRSNPGRKTCSERYRARISGKEKPLQLFSIDECCAVAGIKSTTPKRDVK